MVNELEEIMDLEIIFSWQFVGFCIPTALAPVWMQAAV